MWLGDTCACRCGWVADPQEENNNEVCICSKCDSIYEWKFGSWILKTKTFEERMNET